MSLVTKFVYALQILKGKATKGLKKRHARSAKKWLARAVKASVAAEAQLNFQRVYGPSVAATKIAKKMLIKVQKDLPHIATKARSNL